MAGTDDDDDDGNFPSSVHKVLSNDDLLTDILLRLSLLSLHLLKPVCKQWRSLITSTSFTLKRTRVRVDPPFGFFVFGDNPYDFVSLDPRIPSKRSPLFSFPPHAQIMGSCNGLLLCWDEFQLYVYNPLIRTFKMLPPLHNLVNQEYSNNDVVMAFDPTKSPCYKVVHVGSVYCYDGMHNRIQTYSSETGVWSLSDDRFPKQSFDGFIHGIYWNGAIHWLNRREPFHCKLDVVDHPFLTTIQTPLPPIAQWWFAPRKLLKSRDSLLLFCKDYNSGYYISEMKNGYSTWLVKYYVNFDDIIWPYPTWRHTYDELDCLYRPSIVLGERDGEPWINILSIVLGERDEDSFMVIEQSGKVLQYKFVLESVSELFDLGHTISGRAQCYEYIASFAHV